MNPNDADEHRHMETYALLAKIHDELREINSRMIDVERSTANSASFTAYLFIAVIAILGLSIWYR